MSLDRAQAHLEKYGLADRIIEFTTSSATVSLAAAALGTEEARIAKSLSFMTPDGPIIVVVAGDAKVANKKYKDTFGVKAKMLSFDEVEPLIGHAVGGVCPFGVERGVRVYLDESLRRFDRVYPAAGTSASAVDLSTTELELCAEPVGWVDVTTLSEIC